MKYGRRLPRVLIIGPMPPRRPTKTNPIGGTGVHFSESVSQLRRRAIKLSVVDTNRARTNLGFVSFVVRAALKTIDVTRRLFQMAHAHDVIFLNITAGRASLFGPIVWLATRFFYRPVMMRIFGGDFAEIYDGYTVATKWVADRTFLRFRKIYVQTKSIARRFNECPNVSWFPNTRDIVVPPVPPENAAKRFLFIGQLRPEKGIKEAVDAFRQLPDSFHLSVFGPVMPDTDLGLFNADDRVTYHGTIDHSAVADTILKHDVLLLPTYFSAEGYPGVLIEALQCGRPVISTWWKSIPEIIDHGRSGILVAPRSSNALLCAITMLARDPVFYHTLCQGARKRGEFFRSGSWYDKMARDIQSVAKQSSR